MLRSLQQLLFRKLKNVLITWYCYKIIGCLIDTMRKYLINPSPQKQLSDSGILKSVTAHDLQKIRTILHNHSGHTSKPISKEAEIPETPNATRNRLLRAMADNRAPAAKRTSLTTSGYNGLEHTWNRLATRVYSEMRHAQFLTDRMGGLKDGSWRGTNAIIEPEGSREVAVIYDLARIVDNTIIGPVNVPVGLKITSGTYCEMLKSVILP